MVAFLSSWAKNIALVLIIVSILEMILPNNKTKKYVKMIMGLYILFSIISPFIENSDKFDFKNIDLNSYVQEAQTTSSTSEELDQTSMDNRLNQIYKEELQKDIIEKIEEKGYEVESCNIVAHISKEDSGIEKIIIKISGKINENEDNIDTIENKIVTEIKKIQKVDINVSKNEEKKEVEESTNITKTDIKTIKDFLIKEYGVSEKCLKIS